MHDHTLQKKRQSCWRNLVGKTQPGAFRLPSFPKNDSKWMATEEVKKKTVTNWLNRLAANFYDEVTVKLVQRLDKCLNCNADYVEK
jgi:hypothetical protein